MVSQQQRLTALRSNAKSRRNPFSIPSGGPSPSLLRCTSQALRFSRRPSLKAGHRAPSGRSLRDQRHRSVSNSRDSASPVRGSSNSRSGTSTAGNGVTLALSASGSQCLPARSPLPVLSDRIPSGREYVKGGETRFFPWRNKGRRSRAAVHRRENIKFIFRVSDHQTAHISALMAGKQQTLQTQDSIFLWLQRYVCWCKWQPYRQ